MASRTLKCSLIAMLAFVAGVVGHAQAYSACVPPQAATFQSITRAETESLFLDLAEFNPTAFERLKNDAELRREQIEGLRELLALSTAAFNEGYAADSINCHELQSIRHEVVAVTYDAEKRKGKPKEASFSLISDAMIDTYWRGTASKPLSPVVKKQREADFQKFSEFKLALTTTDNPAMKDKKLSEDEIKAARDFYAKIRIYSDEYYARSATMTPKFKSKVALQVKLQQAQFLARRYTARLAAKSEATEREIDEYIASRPELSGETKRAEAEKLLERAKSGEDFAKLANEFSQDPGNKGANGVLNGGIYREVKKGIFVKPFEDAVMAIEAGQIYPSLVESDFGYHIIKLERKGNLSTPTGSYDARHILISTTIPDPSGRELPLRSYVESKIEAEKQRKLIAEIVAASNISVPDDFAVPVPSAKPAAKTRAANPARRPVRKRR